MSRLDDTSHLLFGCSCNDVLQEGVQLGQPGWGVIDPNAPNLMTLFINDQGVMVG